MATWDDLCGERELRAICQSFSAMFRKELIDPAWLAAALGQWPVEQSSDVRAA